MCLLHVCGVFMLSLSEVTVSVSCVVCFVHYLLQVCIGYMLYLSCYSFLFVYICGGDALCLDVFVGCELCYCLQCVADYIHASFLNVCLQGALLLCSLHHWLYELCSVWVCSLS